MGDLAYRLWCVTISGCSRAERAVAWREAEACSRATNTYDNIGLANNYVWLLLQYAGTMLLFLMFPLVSPAFLLYLVVKHLVDLHNFRLFYTAMEPQPTLLRTAVRIAVSASVLAQASLTLVYVTTEINDWRGSDYRQVTNMNTTTWSTTLLVVNCTMLLIEQSSGWLWPVRLFSRPLPAAPVGRKQEHLSCPGPTGTLLSASPASTDLARLCCDITTLAAFMKGP